MKHKRSKRPEETLTKDECRMRGIAVTGEGSFRRYYKNDSAYIKAQKHGVSGAYDRLETYWRLESLCGNIQAIDLAVIGHHFSGSGHERQEYIEFIIRLKKRFYRWVRRIKRLSLDRALVRAIITEDMGFCDAARRFGIDRHTVAGRFLKALMLW